MKFLPLIFVLTTLTLYSADYQLDSITSEFTATNNDDTISVVNDVAHTLNMLAGNDSIEVCGNISATALLGDGDDTLYLKGDGGHTIDAGAGNDIISINGNLPVTLLLGSGDDTIYIANTAGHTIQAYTGNDEVCIGGDVIASQDLNDGDDKIYVAGDVSHSILAGRGNDVVIIDGDVSMSQSMGDGDDYVSIGGAITHTISGGTGTDSIDLIHYSYADYILHGSYLPSYISSFENIRFNDGFIIGNDVFSGSTHENFRTCISSLTAINTALTGDCLALSAPNAQDSYSCGVFSNVLTSYDSIYSGFNHPANNDEACFTETIAYPVGALTGDILCSPTGCGGASSCQRVDPPANKLSYSWSASSKLGTPEPTPTATLTDYEYGDFNGNFNMTLAPATLDKSSTPVMVLGDITLTSSNTLSLQPGDYFFNSLTFTKNNPQIVLPSGGLVRIFIQNDFVVTKNGLNVNKLGNQNDLFVYVAGDMDFLTSGNVEVLKGYFYVEGSAQFNANSSNFEVHGGITAEGPINISGNNGHFYQQGSSDTLGYGECNLCFKEPINTTLGLIVNTSTDIVNSVNRDLTSLVVSKAYERAIHNLNHSTTTGTSSYSSTISVKQDGLNYFTNPSTKYGFVYDIGNFSATQTDRISDTTYFAFNLQDYDVSLANRANVKVIYQAKYTDNGKDYDILLQQCSENGGNNLDFSLSSLNAWDTFRDNVSVPPSDQNISTKIVNRPFSLSLASMNQALDAYQTINSDGGSVEVSIYPLNSTTKISNSISFDANATAHVASSPTFTVNEANQNAIVGFKLCATYISNVFHLYPDSNCTSTAPITCDSAVESTVPQYFICRSQDNFAIRPFSFKVFGDNQYKRAGEDFNLVIKAVDENNNSISSGSLSSVSGVRNYNISSSSLRVSSNFYTPSPTDLTQMQSDTGKTSISLCPQSGSFSYQDGNFSNGELNVTMNFTETGILDINVSERVGNEFALVDAADTSDAQRLIQSTLSIYDTSDISQNNLLLFVPYKFVTTAEYNSTNSKNWLYMSDINGSNSSFTTPQMSAFLKYTITAQNKNGDTTRNYTSTCFPDTNEVSCPRVNGLKLNTTFDLFLNATLNSDSSADLSLYTEDNSSSALWTPTKNVTLSSGNKNIQEWISPFQFSDGVGKASVYFNIDKKTDKALNPMKIKVVDINTSTSWMANAGSPKEFIGTTLNKELTFVYGRTHVQRHRFTGDTGTALVYYEIYCNGTIDGNSCKKSLLPNGLNSTTTDDPRWFVNPDHNTSDGVVGNVSQKRNSGVSSTNVLSNSISLHYLNASTKGYPYKTTMQNQASNWLIYNPFNINDDSNEFEVEFIGGSGEWVGVSETQTSTNKNASSKTNRRSMW